MKWISKVKDFLLNNKLKVGLILTVLVLTIGYAAVNTSLNIAGNIELTRNSSLKIFFNFLSLDGVDIENQLDNNRESFTIKQSQLKELGTSTINYEIKNVRTDYDAKVSISCTPEQHNNTKLNYDTSEKDVFRTQTIPGTLTAISSEPKKEKIYDIVKNQMKGPEKLLNYSTISSATNGQGVYSTTNTDSGTEVYFYRGEVTNNNVIFAGYCWQIIRTTETGGVKLLYNGSPNGGQCQKPSGNGIATVHYNSKSDDNAYVGYMYGTPSSTLENTHANVNSSLLKNEIDKWYEENILGKEYEEYLEDTVWCNDRSISTGTGVGKNDTRYAFVARLASFNPTLKCARATDKLTVVSGYLKYPIATLTADELIYAGVGGPMNADGTSTNNTTMFLNNGGTFWTLTPRAYSTEQSKNYVQGISYFGTGNISTVWTNIAARTMGVRPAISLKNEVEASSGDGSFTTPYIIGENNQGDTSTNVDNTEYTCKLNVTLVDPSENLIGKEYCIGTECFNIIGYDDEHFKLLSKYNLLVGTGTSETTPNYGHQDPSALADKVTPAIGTVAFGDTNEYSTSKVKTYVDNYVSWLNNTYKLHTTGRLIENDELIEIGCQLGVSQGCGPAYNKHHEWLLRTTFYTQTKEKTADRIYLVGGDGYFGGSAVSNSTNRGVRPVIIIPKNEIDIEPPKKVIPVEWLDDGVFAANYNQAFDKLQTLSLQEKVGQLLVVSYVQSNASDADNAVENYNLGGVLFFEDAFTGKTIDQVKNMTSRLQSKAKIPLMMSVDEEGGRVVRISPNENLISEEKSKYPNLFFTNSNNKTAWKLASTLYTESGKNFELVKQEENIRNNLLKKLGLNMNFAPVVDIATPPAYISDRSFGNDPQLVAEYATAVINAGKNSGVSHSLKHFPGYGNNADTHSSTSVDETNLEDLNNIHLVPFKTGIKAGAHAVMITHNTVAALDKTYPASLSESVHNFLFDDLGFTGIAITDDLAMGAIGNKYSNQYLKAFKAGNHILLTSTSYATAYNEILAAVNSGEITEEELDKRVFKVLAWKYYNGVITE